MMFSTQEMRWFFAGAVPPLVAAWFGAQVCAALSQPPRTDFYLQLDGDDSLGVKLREGRMEVKQREGAGVPVQLGEQAVGQMESWRKWSFGLADTGNVTEQWVGVWKARRWCLFDVGENGRIIPTLPATVLEQGCACELTEIHLVDSPEPWWSLGLEAFGGTAVQRRERLLLVAKTFLTQPGAPSLPSEQSYSYPKWLQMAKRD
ncbi:MAG: hypothetical protein H6667_10595 [Ardenticatenaceae bacterium]|nr:hypothetical protein [Ardenticatenaceae bacterium]